MNVYQKAKSYQSVSVETASPGKLILMLLDGALRFVEQARQGFEIENFARRNEVVHNGIMRADKIVLELQRVLNFELGKELAEQLYGLYEFVHQQLLLANSQKQMAPMLEGQKVIQELRNAWAEMLAQGSLEAKT
jgi:flagellar protein FliS